MADEPSHMIEIRDTAALGAADDAAAVRHVEAILAAPVEKLFKDDRTRVWSVRVDGRGWVIKQLDVGAAWRVPVVGWIKARSLLREAEAARQLARIGVRIPQPTAIVTGSRRPALILPLIEGKNLYHVIEQREGPRAWRRWLAGQIGRQIGAMAAAGIVNRDHKVGNLIVDQACRDGLQPPVLIDPAGLRASRGHASVFKVMAHLYRTAAIAGVISPSECLACVRGLIEAMPALGDARAVWRGVAQRVKTA